MAKKVIEMQVNIPLGLCFPMVRAIGDELGWKLREEKPSRLKWVKGTWALGPSVLVYVDFKLQDDYVIGLDVTGELPGAFDAAGFIPAALELFYPRLERVIREIEGLLRDGLLCPKCGKKLPPGTKFCPNDGTTIAHKCPKCGSDNIPSARFCASCGEKI